MKRIVATLLSAIMIISFNTVVFANETDNYGYLENEENVLAEDILAVVKDFEVAFELVETTENAATVRVTISNTGDEILYNWYLLYGSSFVIDGIEDAEILMNEDIHYIKGIEDNCTILPGEEIKFTMEISFENGYVEPEEFRLYTQVPVEIIGDGDHLESCDVISYDLETETYDLNLTDISDDVNYISDNEVGNTFSSSYSVSSDDDILNDDDLEISPYNVIGAGYARERVNNVTSNPYIRIAALVTTWPDGSETNGTGFMVSKNYMLTAAHLVYDDKRGGSARSVVAYFGRDGINYSYKYYASTLYWSVNYPTNKTRENDWGALRFDTNVGSTTGWFGVGYVNNETLAPMLIRVTGYPGDKMIRYNSFEDKYKKYMYTSNSPVHQYSSVGFSYKADTDEGQSGSPVYKNDTEIVYGINNGGGSKYNTCRRINQSLFDMMIDEGWIGY